MRLPFSRFESELLTEINVAPAQLHPNGWAFVKAFDILCGFFGRAPSVDIFLPFFRSEEAGEEPLGEPQQHTWKGPPDLIPTILQGVEGKILQSLLFQL